MLMRPRFLVAALLVLAVISAGLSAVLVGRAKDTVKEASAQGEALIGGPFSLLDHKGERVTDEDFRGRYMLVFFGYTSCPDVCPLGLQVMGQAMDQLPPQIAEKIAPIFVTVDPERDTVPVMKDYVELFHPQLVGLTGSAEEIDAAKRAYRIYARKAETEGSSDYLMDHSAFTYLMDASGRYLTHFSHDATAEEMAARIEKAVPSS
ncbi:SCO family protein [Marinimicrococcus flavescens]|uniref:SCO family protein n=1 Tax=Marinimicrococcus flavescens TaxID=3031815 RepID=A0AAP3XRP6_9PROT|nr:SCO family protein [Marinimicrococcus flavescens]